MRTLILLLLPLFSLAQLPSSGSLSLKSAAGAGRSISQQVDGNETGSKSLTTLSTTASKTAPHSMLEFYGYPSGPPLPGTITNCASSLDGGYPGGRGVDISWTNPASGGTPEETLIEVSVDGGAYTELTRVDYPSTTYDHPSVFTDAAKTYTYRLSAVNATGAGPTCTTTLLNFPARPTTMAAPTSTNLNPNGIRFSWVNPGGAAVNGYILSVNINGGSQVFGSDVGNVLNYTVPDSYLTDGQTYNGSIQSYNANNSAVPSPLGGVVTYSVSAPGVPTSVAAAHRPTFSDIVVTYNSPASGGTVTNYRIERSVNAGAYAFKADNGTALSYSDNSIISGNTYKYRVRAENSGGNSAYVETGSVTVP